MAIDTRIQDSGFSIPEQSTEEFQKVKENDEAILNSLKKVASKSKTPSNVVMLESAKESKDYKLNFEVDELKEFVLNTPQSIHDTCAWLRSKGLSPIPTKPMSKFLKEKKGSPYELDNYFATIEHDKKYFEAGDNISIKLGPQINNPETCIVDLDLEIDESRKFAYHLLKNVNTTSFGRRGAPHSHYLFKCKTNQVSSGQSKFFLPNSVRNTEKENEDSKGMILELRPSGHCMIPPSSHPSGEVLFWMQDKDIPNCSFYDIRQYAQMIAAGSLLMKHWSPGSRDTMVTAFIGFVLSNGWNKKHTTVFLRSLFNCVWPIDESDKRTWIRRIDEFHREIERKNSQGEELEDENDSMFGSYD